MSDCDSAMWINGYAVNFSYIDARGGGERFKGLAVFDPAHNRSVLRIEIPENGVTGTVTTHTWGAIGEEGISFEAPMDDGTGCYVLHNESDGISAAFGKNYTALPSPSNSVCLGQAS